MAKKVTHGGKRTGSGRKPASPEGRTVLVTASVPGGLVEGLDTLAGKQGWNRSEAVTEAIRGLLATKSGDRGLRSHP
jgi:hypothetical protein